ncbi:MAG: hypothetical protein EA351_05590 [Gemmatimonadales bacterium]|nr:MAG: hypothetical protein EA351_05590 [Gemmatimonadales bacterium]
MSAPSSGEASGESPESSRSDLSPGCVVSDLKRSVSLREPPSHITMTEPTNDRIHKVLDGDLDADDLSPAEQREMTRVASASTEAATHLGRLRSPGLAGAVMNEIERRTGVSPDSTGTRGSWVRALWAPRTVAFRPAWGLLAAAVIAALILVPSGESPPAPTSDAEGVTVFVQFRLHAPDASEVRLAGTFTDWEPVHELHPVGDGAWSVMVPMHPGIHDYAFIVDGTDWTLDPTAPRVDDGFGGENSRLALLLVNGARES